MNIIRGMKNLPALPAGCVLTMGNFDGVHLGHQALFRQVVREAKEASLPAIAMIFEPQPREYLHPDKAPARLTSFREKYQQIKQCGIDSLLCISFNSTIASIDASDFVHEWLEKRLKAKQIVIGDDFTFGARREGSPALLKTYADRGQFQLTVVSSCEQRGYRVSSTAIREALKANHFEVAESLLGRPYAITGKVAYGNALGRQLGFPTANLPLRRLKAALQGVFLVEVDDLSEDHRYRGIANIGYRPTVNGKNAILEVYIFDFEQEIYGHTLKVTFLEKIREEQKFASLEKLKKQIAEDVCIAQKISAKF